MSFPLDPSVARVEYEEVLLENGKLLVREWKRYPTPHYEEREVEPRSTQADLEKLGLA